MSLANLLSVEQIIPEMKATERWAAIVELIDLLVSLGKIKTEDRDPILASLKQREETMSTGIGFGIAIPHCSSDLAFRAPEQHLSDNRRSVDQLLALIHLRRASRQRPGRRKAFLREVIEMFPC